MKKKKILIRIGSLRHGGAEKVLATFLRTLDPNKYEIDLLLNLRSGKYLNEIPSWVNILHLNQGEMITSNHPCVLPKKLIRVVYQGFLKKFPKLLYKYILKGKIYDIEFAAIHGMKDEILSSPNTKSKKIVWIHNDLFQISNYSPEKIRDFFRFDQIMVISERIKDNFLSLAKNQTEKDKIVRIYNPLDTKEMIDYAKAPASRYDFSGNIPTFVSVGTVFPQKGFDRLLRVQRRLLDEGFALKVLIIGDGYDFDAVNEIRIQLGLENYATMLGFTPNPYPYIANADFFVLPSRYEGFPTVLFEAITLQKRIIALEVSGAREMLENGKLGMILENSDEQLYQGIKNTLINPDLFKNHLKELENYKAPFKLETSVQDICKILDNL